jgi:hypothetical protein
LFEGNIFSNIIQPNYLNNVTLFLVGLNLFFTALTFIYLRQKKKIYSIQKGIQKSLELWISRILLNEDETETQPAYLQIPLKFQKHFKNKTKREFTINQLTDIKKNLTGEVVDNIINLYEHSGLKQDSIRKFKSKAWHKKVKGINELYMMNQKDMLDSIYKHTNSHNEYVRMEAQTAMIHFYGFEGLKFLDIITHPVSEWEQLKLLEQLKTLDFAEMKNLSQWLKSPNFTVVIFALKLADVYQQYEVHDEVVECLQHENEKVRVQAVTTLGRVAGEDTASVLAKHYLQEHFTNRQNILNCLLDIASHNEKDFLLQQLDDDNDSLKLAAARVIAKCCDNGFEILKDKAKQQPNPYREIYFHLKSELQ